MALKSIGIVGCGAIGRALLTAIENGKLSVLIAGVTSRTEKSARDLLSTFKRPPPYLSLPELIAASDLIVEAAGGAVVPGLAEEVFAGGKDLMVISAGALLIIRRSCNGRVRPVAASMFPPARLRVWTVSSPPVSVRSPR